MTKQFLLTGPLTQRLKYQGWRTFCFRGVSPGAGADVVIDIPSRKMPPLSQGLFALEQFDPQGLLVISTQPLSERVMDKLSTADRAASCLSEPDVGYICFRTADDFIRCAKDAIRAHDPLKGYVSLMDVWQQALLKRLGG